MYRLSHIQTHIIQTLHEGGAILQLPTGEIVLKTPDTSKTLAQRTLDTALPSFQPKQLQ